MDDAGMKMTPYSRTTLTRTFSSALFGAVVTGLMAGGLPVQQAFADDDDYRNPKISGVFTTFGGTSVDNTLTIRGDNLTSRSSRYETRVMLGVEGPFEILKSSNTELVVRCFLEGDPNFECDDGDHKLEVAIVRSTNRDR